MVDQKTIILWGRVVLLFHLILAAGTWLSVARGQILDDLTDRVAPVESVAVVSAGKTKTFTFLVRDMPGSYNGFVLQGRATGDYERGFVRFLEHEKWSEWMPLRYLKAKTAPLFYAGYRDDTYRENVPYELRFDAGPHDDIEIVRLGIFDNREDDDALASTDAPVVRLPQIESAIAPPRLVSRSEWEAKPFIGSPVPLAQPTYSRMTFHHAAGFGAETYEEGKAQVKAIQEFHQDVRGWSDIGYHFVFDEQGRLYQGRPFLDNRTDLDRAPVLALGAHVGGANTGNIGVSLLGCYHPPEGANCMDVASPALLDSVVTLYAYLSEQYRIDAANLLGHRDQGATACPGDNNYALLPEIRDRIRELILSGNQPIASAHLDAETHDSGVVSLSWAFTEIIDVASYRIDRIMSFDTLTVFETTDLGAVQTVDAGPPAAGEYEYHLYAVSAAGREQRLSTARVNVAAPSGFDLAENFPNPVTASTNIRYYLEHEGIVRLGVYDISGRLIEMLVDGYQDGDRWYAARFDAGGLASGAYFYRIRVEGFSQIVYDQTRTLLVLR